MSQFECHVMISWMQQKQVGERERGRRWVGSAVVVEQPQSTVQCEASRSRAVVEAVFTGSQHEVPHECG